MEIRKYKCNHCNVEHESKIYENKSEAMVDIFVESSFKKIFDEFKEKHKEMLLEDFCKEFAFEYIYHFHRNLMCIKVDKRSIKPQIKVQKADISDIKKEEDKIDKKLELQKARREKIERVKKGLMDELLTGKKRVNVENVLEETWMKK